MTKKFRITRAIIIVLATILVLLIALLLWLILGDTTRQSGVPTNVIVDSTDQALTESSETPVDSFNEVSLGENLFIVKASGYSGRFMEDGTDVAVSDVFALTIENRSAAMVQYVQISVTLEEETYFFDLTSLPAGASALVLEKTAAAMPADLSQAQYAVIQRANFSQTPSLYPELFQIYASDGTIIIENISDTDISGEIYVYYKTCVDGVYMGGITYRTGIQGLKAGEQLDCIAAHYTEEDGVILFVTYVP